MIDCEHCENWYHPKCVGLPKNTNWKTLKYTCKFCSDKGLLSKRPLDLENTNTANNKYMQSKKLKKQ